MSEFEKQVRHCLIDKGLTMSKVAELMGISVSYLYELVKGTRRNEVQKAKLIELLGMDTATDEEQIIS